MDQSCSSVSHTHPSSTFWRGPGNGSFSISTQTLTKCLHPKCHRLGPLLPAPSPSNSLVMTLCPCMWPPGARAKLIPADGNIVICCLGNYSPLPQLPRGTGGPYRNQSRSTVLIIMVQLGDQKLTSRADRPAPRALRKTLLLLLREVGCLGWPDPSPAPFFPHLCHCHLTPQGASPGQGCEWT